MQKACVFEVVRDGLCAIHYRDIQEALTKERPYYDTGHTEHVLIRGNVYKYAEKAPFVRSGVSVSGGIEYDAARDFLRCHECGEFFQNLGVHISLHEMSQEQYREKHGISRATPLANTRLRDIRRDAAVARQQHKTGKQFCKGNKRQTSSSYITVELVNARGNCKLQLLEKLSELAKKLGRTPTARELIDNNIPASALRNYFGGIGNAVKLIGLTPRATNAELHAQKQTDAEKFVESFL